MGPTEEGGWGGECCKLKRTGLEADLARPAGRRRLALYVEDEHGYCCGRDL